MRAELKKQQEENILTSHKLLGDYYEVAWNLMSIGDEIIYKCLMTQQIADDIKKTNLLLILRNCISSIYYCLDGVEKGYDRTILNNLRMVLEDLSLVIHIYHDDEAYKKFKNGKHQASASIGYARKIRPNDQIFSLYGELSKVSHHVDIELIAMQMVTRNGLISHLKPINSYTLDIQINLIMIIILLTRTIGEFSEEICLKYLYNFYFWINSSKKNTETPIDIKIQLLVIKANQDLTS